LLRKSQVFCVELCYKVTRTDNNIIQNCPYTSTKQLDYYLCLKWLRGPLLKAIKIHTVLAMFPNCGIT